MKERIQAWLRAHRAGLLAFDFWVARQVGAPPQHTLSGYSYAVEQRKRWWGEFWRPRIDGMAHRLFGQVDHCRRAYEKEMARAAAAAITNPDAK